MRIVTILMAGCAGVAVSTPLLAAQDQVAQPVAAASAAAGVSNVGLGEIVVTAQKRAQNLQNVPVAVTAVTGAALTARGINQFADLPKISPSLTITENTNATSGTAIIRGIGTSAVSISIEPSVAIVVDDVALLQQAQAFSGLNDIARVEVLRGPQGTLFGKASSAGVINIVTAAPTRQLSGHALATLTTDGQRRIEGGLAGPLTDGVGFRVNAFYDDRDGFVQNLAGGPALGADRSYGAQAKLVAKPIDRLEITLNGSYVKENGNETPRTFLNIGVGQAIYGTPLTAADLAGITPGPDNYKTRQDVTPKTRSTSYMVSGRVRYSLGPVDLVSISSYQNWKYWFLEDLDYTTVPTGGTQTAPFSAHQFSEELRLVSTSSGPLQYLAGFYYSDGESGRGLYRTPPSLSYYYSTTGSRTLAGFGQATYDFNHTTHIDAGVRYNYQKLNVSFLNTTPLAADATPRTEPQLVSGCFEACTGSSGKGAVTGKVSLRKDLSSNVHAYALVVTGQKGEAYDISTGFTPTRAANPVKQETSLGYEVGLKTRLFDNHVQLNLAAFWTDYKNFQAQGRVPQADGTLLLQLANVGKLRTRGIEAELDAQATRSLEINAAATYLEATILKYPLANCYTAQTAAEGCVNVGTATAPINVQNLAGKTLPNAPRFKFNVGATYTIDMPDQPFNGYVSLDYNWQTKVNYDLAQNPLAEQGAYGIFSGSFGLKPHGDRGMQVAFFIHNILDKHYTANISSPAAGAPVGSQSQILTRDSTRYAGVRVGYNF